MKKIKHLIILFGIIGIFSFSCEKEKIEIETDPAKAILGKWEIIEIGNWPNMELTSATGYTEFLSDSIVRFFEYDKNQFTSQAKYWIDDSLLYDSHLREDGFELVFKRKYLFFDKNQKLRLDYVDMFVIFNTSIYKRIN